MSEIATSAKGGLSMAGDLLDSLVLLTYPSPALSTPNGFSASINDAPNNLHNLQYYPVYH